MFDHDVKIRIKNPEHSACVQKKLFEMGYVWQSGDTEVMQTGCKYLYVDFMYITCGSNEEWFLTDKSVEYVFSDEEVGYEASLPPKGHFAPNMFTKYTVASLEKPLAKKPIGLRPKYIADLQRMKEILEAMERYAEADVPVPQQWLYELKDLSDVILNNEKTDIKFYKAIDTYAE